MRIAPPVEPPAEGMPEAWQVGRIAMGFYIDLIEIGRERADLLTPLLLAAVVDANLTPLQNDQAGQLRYASLAAPPDDDVRRPVSINALAESLSLPFETVRRRLRLLQGQGRCVIGADGVIVPASVLSTEPYIRQALARYDRLRQFYADLTHHAPHLLVLPRAAIPASAAVAGEAPVRLCNRLISHYFLRQTEVLLGDVRDPYGAFILLQIARANVRALPLDPRSHDLAAQPAMRKVVRPRHLADHLGLPSETVRRRLKALAERGYVQRTQEGARLSDSAMTSQLMRRLTQAAVANTVRMFTSLHVYGVIDRWRDGEGLPDPREP